MNEQHPDSDRRRETSRRAFLAVSAGASVGLALGFAGASASPAAAATGTTYYVATNGDDNAAGTSAAPLKTINKAAEKAQPGDTVLVRGGTYREEVIFPRGGTSDNVRITYKPDAGASVTVTGSNTYNTWTKVSGTQDVYQLKIKNGDFNGFNPYAEQVHGDWFVGQGRIHRRGMVYLNGAWLPEATSLDAVKSNGTASWWSTVDGLVEGTAPKYVPSYDTNGYTTITAKFPGVDPNSGAVEVGMRGTVFKPKTTNCNYITISGFNLRNAATNWAPPTMGQWGLVSAYWCKGWTIEDNEIAYSRCCGIALGKYSDDYDGLRGSTDGYQETIKDAQTTGGWSFDKIGGHIVQNNTIHHCGQTGIVGSLGGIGSTITKNEIYHINTQGIWSGYEMAGIKLHGAIDVVISKNHIYNTGAPNAIWLDWMAQGTQVIGNLFHDNVGDIYAEVDHGPLFIANNVMLSADALTCWSDGAAWAHNLVTGIVHANSDARTTPYFAPHSTAQLAPPENKLAAIPLGAQQWVNNILGGSANLSVWNAATAPISMKANVYTKGATKSAQEQGGVDASSVEYRPGLSKESDGWYLLVPRVEAWRSTQAPVSTDSLAHAPTPDQPFTNPDGSAMSLQKDFRDDTRSTTHPFPGPFETVGGTARFKVWDRVMPTTDAWGRKPSPSGPGAATDTNGAITVYVRGTNHQLYQNAFNGTPPSWTGWQALGGPNDGIFVGAPAVTMINGRTDIFVRGTDNQLWQRTWTATGGIGNWTARGGVLVDNPGAATDANGRINVHVRGTDNQLYQNAFDGNSWTGWAGLGGPNSNTFTGAPAVTMIDGTTNVFVRGTDNQLWQRTWTRASGFGNWTARGGTLVDNPAAATDANGKINVHVRGTDNQLYQNAFDGNSWTGWAGLGGPNSNTFAGAPAVTMIDGTTNVFVRGTDNQLWQRTWTRASGFGNWTARGGVLG
ncbi:right-handed parallel beta-helix repeat-containing protein [Streptomyces tubercidicus]|uniref:right-handed parallel beta-helix repeat-containing protein n=1 Tax=Streptomyces tubercidicus TaxID=47759 RepID=UPI003465A90D